MASRISWWSPEMTGSELGLVKAVLDSNFLNDGDVTEEFAGKIAKLVDAKFGVGVTSGTSAIYLSLVALGCKAGVGRCRS
jgi:dTDP-4-amino-4,6-dideoxygalactose transaminase